jgi:magnesium chelatase subunit D
LRGRTNIKDFPKSNQGKTKNLPKSKIHGKKNPITVKREDIREKVRKHGVKAAITVVIDLSGSMISQEKLHMIKSILRKIISNVEINKDKLAVVGFKGKDSELIIPNTKRPTLFLNNLQNISIGGTTPMAAGLVKALEILLKDAKGEEYIPMMLILSDGVTNVGLDKVSEKNHNKNIRNKIEKNKNMLETSIKNGKKLISNPINDALAAGEEIAKNKIHTVIVNFEKEENKGLSVNKKLAFITNGRFYDLGNVYNSLDNESNSIDSSNNSLIFDSVKSNLLNLAIDGILNHERNNI